MARRPLREGFDDARPLFERIDLDRPATEPVPVPLPRAEDEPHYHGHRERLRARFTKSGAEGLHDYELLELLLFRALPRRDVKPLAKDLIQRFGGFAAVLSAEPARLAEVKGLGASAIADLKIVQAAALAMLRAEIKGRSVITSWRQLIDYCQAAMGHETREQFRVLFLDKKNQLIADEIQQEGTVDHTAVYPREIVRRALELSASAFILVHNHPSGDATPSAADIKMTKEIITAADALGLKVHDHVVIGRSGHASLRSLGLM